MSNQDIEKQDRANNACSKDRNSGNRSNHALGNKNTGNNRSTSSVIHEDTGKNKSHSSKRSTQDEKQMEIISWKPRAVDWQSALTDQIVIVHGPDQYAQAMEDPNNQEAALVGIAANAGEY